MGGGGTGGDQQGQTIVDTAQEGGPLACSSPMGVGPVPGTARNGQVLAALRPTTGP